MSNPGTPPPMLNMINSGALGAMPNASSRKVVGFGDADRDDLRQSGGDFRTFDRRVVQKHETVEIVGEFAQIVRLRSPVDPLGGDVGLEQFHPRIFFEHAINVGGFVLTYDADEETRGGETDRSRLR